MSENIMNHKIRRSELNKVTSDIFFVIGDSNEDIEVFKINETPCITLYLLQ